MNKRSFIALGVLVVVIIIAAALFFFWKYPVEDIKDTGSALTLPVSEKDILVPDPNYYLSKIQPYFQELENAVNTKDFTAALTANEIIHDFLLKMAEVTVVSYAKEQVQFLINVSDDEKNALHNQNEAAIKSALEKLRLVKVLQFQSQRGAIGER